MMGLFETVKSLMKALLGVKGTPASFNLDPKNNAIGRKRYTQLCKLIIGLLPNLPLCVATEGAGNGTFGRNPIAYTFTQLSNFPSIHASSPRMGYSSSLITHKKRGKFPSVESSIEFDGTLNRRKFTSHFMWDKRRRINKKLRVS